MDSVSEDRVYLYHEYAEFGRHFYRLLFLGGESNQRSWGAYAVRQPSASLAFRHTELHISPAALSELQLDPACHLVGRLATPRGPAANHQLYHEVQCSLGLCTRLTSAGSLEWDRITERITLR